MSVLMVQSKIRPEAVVKVQAATEKVYAALDVAHPEGIRYATLLLPDGDTFVAMLQIDDGVEDAVRALPEYRELIEVVEGSRAAPPVVHTRCTVVGSHRLF